MRCHNYAYPIFLHSLAEDLYSVFKAWARTRVITVHPIPVVTFRDYEPYFHIPHHRSQYTPEHCSRGLTSYYLDGTVPLIPIFELITIKQITYLFFSFLKDTMRFTAVQKKLKNGIHGIKFQMVIGA